jgi:hypothetical protein
MTAMGQVTCKNKWCHKLKMGGRNAHGLEVRLVIRKAIHSSGSKYPSWDGDDDAAHLRLEVSGSLHKNQDSATTASIDTILEHVLASTKLSIRHDHAISISAVTKT